MSEKRLSLSLSCSFSKSKNTSVSFLIPLLPATLEKFTTRPRAFFTNGKKVLVTSIIPHRFTSAMRLKMFRGVHSMGSVSTIPALFTRPHNPVVSEKQKCKLINLQTKVIFVGTELPISFFSVFFVTTYIFCVTGPTLITAIYLCNGSFSLFACEIWKRETLNTGTM